MMLSRVNDLRLVIIGLGRTCSGPSEHAYSSKHSDWGSVSWSFRSDLNVASCFLVILY